MMGVFNYVDRFDNGWTFIATAVWLLGFFCAALIISYSLLACDIAMVNIGIFAALVCFSIGYLSRWLGLRMHCSRERDYQVLKISERDYSKDIAKICKKGDE